MNHRLLIGVGVLLAIVSPSAEGQKRGTAAPDWDKMSRTSSPGSAPQLLTKKDMEEMDPIKRLIDKRKDLKLSDGQLAKLKEMDAAAKVRDASAHEMMDSLRKELRPASGTRPSDADRLRLSVTREHFAKAVMSLRASYSSDAAAALATLDEAQRPVATALVEQQRAEGDETISEKMRGGGASPQGRPAGPPGGGRRPPATS